MEVGISDEAIENAFRMENIQKKWISKMCKKCDIFKDIIIFQILSFGFHVYFLRLRFSLYAALENLAQAQFGDFPWWANGPYSSGLGPCCYPPEVGK